MSTWIYDKRKAAGFSQSEIANILGMSRPTYMKLEDGERKPTAREKSLLAQALSVSSDQIDRLEKAQLPKKSAQVELREIPKENTKKFKQTLLYILGKVGSRPNIGQTALYKLLYFMDFDYYEKYEEQFIGATYIKNTYGPTPVSFAKIIKEMKMEGQLVEVKSKYFDHDQTKYIATQEADVSCLDGKELKHIDDELARLAHKSARELSDLSHLDTPWRVAQEKEVLNYEHVFYRPEETSVGEYEPL